MPLKLIKAGPEVLRAYDEAYAPTPEDADCRNKNYQSLANIEPLALNKSFIGFATPDSAYAVTKRMLNGAQRKILIGIYDFTVKYIKDLLLKAVAERHVEVSLMLDCNFNRIPQEEGIFKELSDGGVKCVPAPSCQGGTNRYFKVCHEKVIVIDDLWTIVQSGNYTQGSMPQNEGDGVKQPPPFRKGYRDMGIAIESKRLAKFFTELLEGDMKRELGEEDSVEAEPEALDLPTLFMEVEDELPINLYPSKPFPPKPGVQVLPVLTPDNYMKIIPDALSQAQKSIYIEQQYIRSPNLNNNPSIKKLVEAIRQAKQGNEALDVRIIVAPPYKPEDLTKLKNEMAALETYGLEFGTHVRVLNRRYFNHCHNKLIVIDDERVLVSSQNWSEPAVTDNREAGVLIDDPDIAQYFSRIFREVDWETGIQSLDDVDAPVFFTLEEDPAAEDDDTEAITSGKFVQVDWPDYVEV